MPPVFDTLTYAREMERAGFTREQAEGLANGQARLIDDRLATKDDVEKQRLAFTSDLDGVRGALSREIGNVQRGLEDLRKDVVQGDKDIRAEIKSSQRETINRLGLLIITVIGAGTAILGFVARISH